MFWGGRRRGIRKVWCLYDEKAGIAKLISAEKLIDGEFAKDIKELEDGTHTIAAIWGKYLAELLTRSERTAP